jgi:hypothetical protein
MPTIQRRIPCEQLDLFQSPPTRPRWRNLPPEVQSRVLELLTHLLREPNEPPRRGKRAAAVARGMEACDE